MQFHGLTYWKEGSALIVAEAQYDRITLIDIKKNSVIAQMTLAKNGMEAGMDNCHINDLFVHGNRLFVSMISQSGLWKSGMYDGCIIEIDLPSLSTLGPIMLDLLFPHSVKLVGKNFYVLESLTGKLLSGKKQVAAQLGGFVRGLWVSGGLAYVGQSRNRRLDEAIQYMSSISMDSGIYVVDLNSKVYRFIKLPEMCDVYDILDLQ